MGEFFQRNILPAFWPDPRLLHRIQKDGGGISNGRVQRCVALVPWVDRPAVIVNCLKRLWDKLKDEVSAINTRKISLFGKTTKKGKLFLPVTLEKGYGTIRGECNKHSKNKSVW